MDLGGGDRTKVGRWRNVACRR